MKTKFVLPLLFPCALAFADGSSVDANFVTKAADAGMTEIATGKLATEKAKDSKIKAFGQQMVDDHTKANDELKAIAKKDQFNVPGDISPAHKAASDRLATLDGADFDATYSKMAVSDHEEAVALFKAEASSGSNPDLRSFAQKTLPTLQHHLEMSKQLPH